MEPELAQAGLAEYFDVRVISSDYGFRKPDRRLFAKALQLLDARPSEAIYVGDNLYRDIAGAQSAGIRAVFVQRHSQQEVADGQCAPDLAVRNLDELVKWLQK